MRWLKNKHLWQHWLPAHVLGITGLITLCITHAWTIALCAVVFWIMISGLGIAVGNHRYFSHNSFTTTPFWQRQMLYWGTLACHGNALFWIALHNGVHHRHADTERDAHSPTNGIWHSYQGYVFTIDPSTVPMRSAVPFLRRPEWQWAVQHYTRTIWSTWLVAAVLDWRVLLGLGIAQTWAIHQEAVVNVLGHWSGFGAYRNWSTDDHSYNRNVLGLFTWGQALHNNHHHDPRQPFFDGGLGEWDPCRMWIKLIRTQE